MKLTLIIQYNAMFCWETLDPRIRVDATWHPPKYRTSWYWHSSVAVPQQCNDLMNMTKSRPAPPNSLDPSLIKHLWETHWTPLPTSHCKASVHVWWIRAFLVARKELTDYKAGGFNVLADWSVFWLRHVCCHTNPALLLHPWVRL